MSSDSAPAKSFSLSTALSETLRYAVLRTPHFFKISWPILVAMVALFATQIIIAALFPITQQELQYSREAFWRHMAQTIIFGIAYSLLQLAFFIIVVRDYILKEHPVSVFPVFGAVLLRTIGLMVVLLGVGIAILFPAGLVGSVALQDTNVASRVIGIACFAIGILSTWYVASRWITWVVSHAVERPQTLGEAWNATGGVASFKIFAGVLMLIFLFFAVAIPLSVGMSFALNALGQLPQPSGPTITIGAVVAAIIQLPLGMLLFAAFSVYAADVLRQTQTAG